MVQRHTEAEGAELARLVERVEQWRQTRAKLAPMPASLWKRAVALGRRLGINPVKSALGLNYNALRARVEARDEGGVGTAGPAAGFVELSGAQVLGLPTATGPVLEVATADGARLTVQLAAGTEVDVARLVEAFRRPSA